MSFNFLNQAGIIYINDSYFVIIDRKAKIIEGDWIYDDGSGIEHERKGVFKADLVDVEHHYLGGVYKIIGTIGKKLEDIPETKLNILFEELYGAINDQLEILKTYFSAIGMNKIQEAVKSLATVYNLEIKMKEETHARVCDRIGNPLDALDCYVQYAIKESGRTDNLNSADTAVELLKKVFDDFRRNKI